MATGPAPRMPIDVSAVFLAARVAFVRTLGRCLALALVAIVCSELPMLYLQVLGRPLDLRQPPEDPAFWALALAGLVGYQAAAGGLLLRQAALLGRGEPPPLLPAVARALPALLAGALATGLCAGMAFAALQAARSLPLALLAVPAGAWLFVALLPMRPVAMLEATGPLRLLQRCVALARGQWLRFLATGLIALMVLLVCVVAAGALIDLVREGLVAARVAAPAVAALGAAVLLALDAVALVYLNSVWLALHAAAAHSADSSSA